jgi:antitoxin (DNA-binding transcriptional repressor) of toxin-antitoxin stability system
MVMNAVGIAELKAPLSRYLRRVRRGRTLTVLDRSTPVALLEAVDLVVVQRPTLARACEPFPVPLGTLDALHLATLLVCRERMAAAPVLATHDTGLALAARSFGVEVVGC